MDEIRQQIQELDKDLIELIARRMQLSQQLGKFKKETNTPIIDKEREKELLEFWKSFAEEKGLSPEFIKQIWEPILKESIRIQEA